MLEADVEVDRRDFPVVVGLRVEAGERLALFGASGSGKTTTLEAIAGLTPLRRGRVALAGEVLTQTWAPQRAVPPWRRRIGLLRQDPGLFPHLTVRQNLCYGRREPRSSAAPPELTRIAAELGIERLLADRPGRLSGGQAHRVALGRLLLARCGALLLDEPYTGLDAALRRSLTALVRTVVAEREVPAVLVAHELAEAQAFADRVAVIDAGRLLQAGSPSEVVARPASRRVAELVGYRGFVADGGAWCGVHPERVMLGAYPDRGLACAGVVRDGRPSGAGWDAEVMVNGEPVWCHLPERPGPAGEAIVITVLDPPRYASDGSALPDPTRVRR